MTNAHEGSDRANLSLPPWDLDTISAVSKVAGSKMVVVFNGPGAVLTPFRDSVAAVIAASFGGQEAGNSLADVLFGDVNPSGRLSITMPGSENEMGITNDRWPGVNGVATYSE